MSAYLLVFVVGTFAGVISGVIGTGSSIILLPVLAFFFGPVAAVPIMAIAAVMANVARILAWWRVVDWKACAVYSLGGIPGAALGARTLLSLPESLINAALGGFFLVMIPLRHRMRARRFRLSLWQLGLAGAVIGYLTGLVLSTGPLSVPAFTAYGLSKGAFIATEAAGSLFLYLSKLTTFGSLDALPWAVMLKGALVGSSLMLGTFVGKAVMLHLSEPVFQRLLDALMLCSGLSLLWIALAR